MRPFNWIAGSLESLVSLQRGFDITKKEQEEGPYWVISSSGPSSTHSAFKVAGPGVLIGRKGTLGTVFYSECDFWPHDTTLWVKHFHGNDQKFCYYLLKTMCLERFDCGASNPTLNRNHIHQLQIRYPLPPTQRRIASILSAYDDLIENNTRRIKILEEMAQMLYREWFVNFRFPGHGKVRMVDSHLGLTPKDWGIRCVTDAVWVNPPTKVPKEGTKPFLPMAGVSEDSMLIRDIEEREGNSGSKFKNGDTIFARITPCLENGKTGFIQFLPSESAVAFGSTEFIVLRSKTVSPEYVYLMARSQEFRENAIKSMSGATGRQRVQEACFGRFFIAQPDGDTLERFTSAVTPMFRHIHSLSQKNSNLRTTRDLLLPKLISGEIPADDMAATVTA